ncbi:unnamed protein product [Knipowitschia caucasica]
MTAPQAPEVKTPHSRCCSEAHTPSSGHMQCFQERFKPRESPYDLSCLSESKCNGWTINVTRHTEASFGSNAFIRCQFTHPHGPGLRDVTVFWKKDEFNDRRKGDRNPFIFHHDSSQVMEAYRGRTALTGNVQNGDCSLSIQNVTNYKSRLYVRVRAVEFYSFYNYPVSIKVTVATS